MFDPSGFCHIASNARNRQKWSVFLYKTSDDRWTMLQPGYFDAKATELNLHDIIIALQDTQQALGAIWVYEVFLVTGKTTDTVTVTGEVLSRQESTLYSVKADKSGDFETPITATNKGATMTQINSLVSALAGQKVDLTNLINTKADKSGDFVTPITESNKGLTQVEQQALESEIDRAATSGKIIGAYWFGKTEDEEVPNPTQPEQNYFDFLTNTPYKAKADLSGWDAQAAITPPVDTDAQILITSKFWNIPQQENQQGGKAFWSHSESDWAYYPTIISFESPALTGTPTAPDLTADSPDDQIVNKSSLMTALTASVFDQIFPVGSLYLSMAKTNTCPIAHLIPGSVWEIAAADGRALLGTANPAGEAGSLQNGSVPNLTGWFGVPCNESLQYPTTDGTLFHLGGNTTPASSYDMYGPADNKRVVFDASKQHSVYGNTDVVRAYGVLVGIWKRVS